MAQFSQEYLDMIRSVFEKRYKRKLTNKEVEIIAQRLINFGKVCENFYKKKKEAYGDKYQLWYKDFVKDTSLDNKVDKKSTRTR